MTHKTFGTKDAMRQNQFIGKPLTAETKRKAMLTIADRVPVEDIPMILDMLGLP